MENETRRVPTGPGWWWASIDGVFPAPCLVVGRDDAPVVIMGGEGVSVDCPLITWLAPIPDPDRCAALAEAGDQSPEVLRVALAWVAALDRVGIAWDDCLAGGDVEPYDAACDDLDIARNNVADVLGDIRAAGAEGGGE